MLENRCRCMQNACMKTITIRDVSEATHAEVLARAKAKGQSMQEFLLALIDQEMSQPDVDVVLARIRERKEKSSNSPTAEEILSARDADRR